MSCLPFIKRDIRSGRILFFVFLAVLLFYTCVIIGVYDVYQQDQQSMQESLDQFPELSAAFGFNTSVSGLTGYLASLLFGMILVVYPLVYVLMAAVRLVARPIDKGSMACLLASPHSRTAVAGAKAVYLAGSIIALMAATALINGLLCEVLYPGELTWGPFLLLYGGVALLQLALGGIAFFASCLSNQTRTAVGFSAAASIGFYLLQMLSHVSGSLDWLRYLTPFSLFDANGLAAADAGACWLLLPLAALAALFYVLGIAVFRRRDLSV